MTKTRRPRGSKRSVFFIVSMNTLICASTLASSFVVFQSPLVSPTMRLHFRSSPLAPVSLSGAGQLCMEARRLLGGFSRSLAHGQPYRCSVALRTFRTRGVFVDGEQRAPPRNESVWCRTKARCDDTQRQTQAPVRQAGTRVIDGIRPSVFRAQYAF